MPVSAVDVVSPAIEHAKQQLFRPFRLGQWSRLALVGLLAGELGSGGGFNPGLQIPQLPQQSQAAHKIWQHGLGMHPAASGVLAAIIAIVIVIFMVFIVVMLYLNSMMRFVLFDAVIQRECRIRESWKKRNRQGLQYFGWQICFSLVTWFVVVALIATALGAAFLLGWFKNPREHLAGLITGGIVAFFVLFACMIVAMIVVVLTKDFVVPQMALEQIGPVEAWRRLLVMLKTEKWSYAGYIGMKAVLAIAAGMLVAIISIMAVLVLAIPLGGIAVIAIIAGGAAGLGWNAVTITLAVSAAMVCAAFIFYLMCLISVPVAVFFPAYALYFFAPRYPQLQSVLYLPMAPTQPPPFSEAVG